MALTELQVKNAKATGYLSELRRMMQHWADYLDGLAAGADVIPLHKITA